MKKIALFLLVMILFGCSQVNNTAQAGSIEWLRDLSAAKELAKAQNKPILIDFYTEWCGWCKRMDKETFADSKVGEKAKSFICVKIDAEKNQSIASEYNVRGFPSTAFLKPDGTLIEVVPGYMPAAAFIELLDSELKKL